MKCLRTIGVISILALAAAACGSDDDDGGGAAATTTPPATATTDPATDTTDDVPGTDAPATTDSPATTDAAPDEAAEPISIDIGVFPGSLVAVPAYVAVAEGIYADHLLDATLVDFAAAPAATTALFSGDLDIFSNSPGNMMLVNSQRNDLVAIIDNYPAPVWSIVVQDDLDTPNADEPYPAPILDLEGRTIGVPAIGSDGHNFARRFLDDAGLDPETDVTFLAVGLGPDAVSAFAAGQLDVVMAIEPVQTVLESMGGRILLDLLTDETLPEFSTWTSSTYLSSRSHADANVDMMQRFQAAHEQAIDFVRDPANLDRVAEIWFEHNQSLDIEDLRGVLALRQDSFAVQFSCEGTDNVGVFQIDNGVIEPGQEQTCEELAWSGATQYLDR